MLPGVGQLINRQAGKGALLICLMSLILMAGLFLAAYEVTVAVSAIGDQVEHQDKWRALADQLIAQGPYRLLLLMGVAFVVWAYAIIDAARWGARRDREEKAAGKTGSATPAGDGENNQSSLS